MTYRNLNPTESFEPDQVVASTQDGHSENTKTKSSKGKGGWNAAIFIIFVEMAERFVFYGLAGNMIMYLTNVLKESTPVAAKNVNTWMGVTLLSPLLGAFIADSLLGRFKTILFSSIIYSIGMGLLAISASESVVIPWKYRKAVFFVSLYIVSIGEGGHKPCVLTFAADQFREGSVEEKKTKSSFYNWWSLAIVTGASLATFGVVYVQDNIGWGAGFGMVAGAMGLALVIFVLGVNKYETQGPLGSPFTSMARVFVAAARKRNIDELRHGFGLFSGDLNQPATLVRTAQFRFLDKAMILDKHDVSTKVRNPWRICSLDQVEEVKLLLRLIPIWFCCLMYPVAQSLVSTYFVKQSSTMNRSLGSHFKLPSASLQGIMGVTMLITIPIYDRVFVPMATKFTRHPSGITVLQRIGTGIFFSLLSMVVSALVEAKRVGAARHYKLVHNPKAEIPIRVWWLLPQFFLCGLGDSFTFIGLQELFYSQMPPAMRSPGAAANLSISGVGYFISSGIISLVEEVRLGQGRVKLLDDNINRAHLDYFYWIIAGLNCLDLFIYIWFAKHFVYKKLQEEEPNNREQGI